MKDMSKFSKKEEYDLILKNFIFPLIGVPFGGSKPTYRPHSENKLIEYSKSKSELVIYENEIGKKCFVIKVSKLFPTQTLALINTVMSQLNGYRYHSSNNEKRFSYLQLLNEYSYLTQRGVINWLCSDKRYAKNVEFLINSLEKWKDRTYEGKNVNFAFSIKIPEDDKNISEAPEENVKNFCEFLNEEYSATFSDGVNSIIELDGNLRFLGYKSLTSLTQINHNFSVGPVRFADVLNNFYNERIGVMLLTNGDILLIQNKEIKVVKREGKWLNFSKEVFTSFISALIGKDDEQFIKLAGEIYLSALDVSFSHSGGIIAFGLEDKEDKLIKPDLYEKYVSKGKKEPKQKPVLHFIDNLLTKLSDYDSLIEQNKKYFDNDDVRKRIRKREFIQRVAGGRKFFDIDRKLRMELIAMDGATIIRENGNLLAVGAIIQNESGSYGGGRGAAARRLSQFGFAIKISTDGYIECYKDGKKVFNIK